MDHLCYFCLVLLCFHARLFVDALWSPAGKELTFWLSFVMSNCEVVTFPLVSWVRCGARLISVVDVVITPMNPYQPIPFNILSFAVFQSRILIYAGSNIYDL